MKMKTNPNPNPNSGSPAGTAVALGAAVFLALALVGGVSAWLREDIQAARESFVRKVVAEALSGVARDNDPFSERQALQAELQAELQFAEALEMFPARRGDAVVAVAVRARAGGYGGPIEFVAAFRRGESDPFNLIVVRHRETPGIADFLSAPSGGNRALDGVSGATVTSRAIQDAAREVGEWLRESGVGL